MKVLLVRSLEPTTGMRAAYMCWLLHKIIGRRKKLIPDERLTRYKDTPLPSFVRREFCGSHSTMQSSRKSPATKLAVAAAITTRRSGLDKLFIISPVELVRLQAQPESLPTSTRSSSSLQTQSRGRSFYTHGDR